MQSQKYACSDDIVACSYYWTQHGTAGWKTMTDLYKTLTMIAMQNYINDKILVFIRENLHHDRYLLHS